MPRIQPVDPAKAQGKAKEYLDGIQAKLGATPNIFKTFAHSPAVGEFYANGSAALGKSTLSAGLREQLALTVAGANACNYCASAHTAIGKKLGVAEDELPINLTAQSKDKKTQAALTFAKKMVDTKANLSDSDVKAVKDAGYTDAEVLEIIAVVAFNIFTNYFNHIVDTEVDFPKVEAKKLAA
ncbi:MAG: peroxidase-related enzyme [Alphaproteobacteria bacterium]|nr:peroxidase-related enzyme [Alphaproteobacteria bacterium]